MRDTATSKLVFYVISYDFLIHLITDPPRVSKTITNDDYKVNSCLALLHVTYQPEPLPKEH
jgi:hypothetical protein